MKWKLANGGLVTSSKQPLKYKDFDKLVVDDITCDEKGIESWSIYIVNPTEHLKRKCHSGELYISITPRGRFSQSYRKHLPTNYYKITDTTLSSSINDISDSFTIWEFKRDGVDGDIIEDGINGAKKCTIDRLINPDDYDEYFDLSFTGHGYVSVSHYSCSDWRNYVDDIMVVTLWKGPHRKHLKRLSDSVEVYITKDY